ncbi:MAG: hypothetical protein ACJ790_15140 [Myxococcaceae bacterium]
MDVLPSTEVTGLLLCRHGGDRLAFLANQVERIELREGEKFLCAPGGEGVGVESVEVHSESVSLLPTPRLMSAGIGGSLYGFVSVSEALYPVVRVTEFARFLSRRAQTP